METIIVIVFILGYLAITEHTLKACSRTTNDGCMGGIAFGLPELTTWFDSTQHQLVN